MSPNGTIAGFDASLFASRRDRVLDALGDGAMVLPAPPVLLRGGTSELPYRSGSDLFYLSGFTEPDAVLVLRGFADEDRSILFCRPRDAHLEMWSGPRMGPELARTALGIDATFASTRVDADLPPLLDGADRIHFRLGEAPFVQTLVIAALRTARRTGPRRGIGPRGVVDPGVILDELRLRKDPAEIEAIRRAVDVTMQGFRAALDHAAPGRGEWELQAEMEATFRRNGASGPAFATIVGSGANACVLHHVTNDRRMQDGDLVLIDAGAELRMYSGDLTRTAPVSGIFSTIQRRVYGIVDRARRAAIEVVRPGVAVEELHDRALGVIIRGLLDLGALSGSEEEVRAQKAYEPFFPHRTSHWLGLDTHDVGDYALGGMSSRLEEGMVLTVEPGLYFPGKGVDERLAGIGVRIEDDVLVTSSGADVLSEALPTGADEIEALLGRAGR